MAADNRFYKRFNFQSVPMLGLLAVRYPEAPVDHCPGDLG
jgi:hypothetical protein